MLCNLRTILALGEAGGFAVAGFNVFGYEDAEAVVAAAQRLKRPVILMANKDAVAHMPHQIIGNIMITLAQSANVPVCVHLDHATDIDSIKAALTAGFTSVMFDGSQLPFDENVAKTREAVALAHGCNVSVEAEIGAVGYSSPSILSRSAYSDPEETKRFAKLTEVDALAVAIGTVHRMIKQGACLQFDRLDAIRRLVDVPLVVHGSTGVTDEDLMKLVRHGVRKINLGTALRIVFGETLRMEMERDKEEFDRIKLFKGCMAAVQEKAEQKIKLLS